MPETEEFVATGRRKTSVARIRMMPGSGKIDINGRSFEDYFPTAPLQNVVLQPLQTAKAVNAYDLWINASGGGVVGQAGATQLAIARALLQVDANLRGHGACVSCLRTRNNENCSGGVAPPSLRYSFRYSGFGGRNNENCSGDSAVRHRRVSATVSLALAELAAPGALAALPVAPPEDAPTLAAPLDPRWVPALPS